MPLNYQYDEGLGRNALLYLVCPRMLPVSLVTGATQGFSQDFRIWCTKIKHIWGELGVQLLFIPWHCIIHKKYGPKSAIGCPKDTRTGGHPSG